MTDQHTMNLDGRLTEYALGGRVDGTPVLLHGSAGAADVVEEWDQPAAAAGIEILAIARPGCGSTTATAMASAADWTGFVLPVLDNLGWEHFDVVGISSGAVYAYALAAGLPDRVQRVAICSGEAHLADPQVLACYSDTHRAARAQERPWGFAPTDVRQPVRLWHAVTDDEVPFSAMVRTASKLPNAAIRVQRQPGHLPTPTTIQQVLAYLSEPLN